MSIQEHLNKIRNAVYGHEVRESIAKGIETAYDDASENGNANMEVKIARGTHPNLRSRLEEVDNKQQQNTTQLQQIVQLNAKIKGAIANGLGDNSPVLNNILAEIGSNEIEILFGSGVYKINSNISFPTNVTLRFMPGARLSPSEGVTVKIFGGVVAGNQTIFDGLGSVDMHLSSTPILLTWYSGDSFNAKWDKIQRTLEIWRPYHLIVPKPYPNQEGAIEIYPTTADWWGWKLTAPFVIDNRGNNGKIEMHGELRAVGIIPQGLLIDSESYGKVDNLSFPNGLTLRGTNNTDNYMSKGIEITGCARLNFGGLLDIQHCVDGLVLGGGNHSAPVGQAQFETIHIAFVTGKHMILEGANDHPVIGIRFNDITLEQAINNNQDTILIKGNCQDITFRNISYISGVGKHARNIVLMHTSSFGRPMGIKLDNIYATNAIGAGVKCEDTTGGVQKKIEEIKVGYIRIIGGEALNINHTVRFTITTGPYLGNAITIGNTSDYTYLNVDRYGTLTDGGNFTFVNGLTSAPRGDGALPDVNGCKLGQRAYNPSDKTLWERVAMTGVASDDFIKIG